MFSFKIGIEIQTLIRRIRNETLDIYISNIYLFMNIVFETILYNDHTLKYIKSGHHRL